MEMEENFPGNGKGTLEAAVEIWISLRLTHIPTAIIVIVIKFIN